VLLQQLQLHLHLLQPAAAALAAQHQHHLPLSSYYRQQLSALTVWTTDLHLHQRQQLLLLRLGWSVQQDSIGPALLQLHFLQAAAVPLVLQAQHLAVPAAQQA
jgi:hypothetical protein